MGHLGPSWGYLGPSRSHLGAILGYLGAIGGGYEDHLGLRCGHRRAYHRLEDGDLAWDIYQKGADNDQHVFLL